MPCLLAAGLSAACGGQAASTMDAGLARRRDSAGIEIVINRSLLVAPQVHFDSGFVFDIGGLSDDPALELPDGMLAVRRLPDRSVAVAVTSTNQIDLRHYSEDGRLLQLIGRKGNGPGEFGGSVWALCLVPPDTLLALEVPKPRIEVTTLAFDSLWTATYSGRASTNGCLSDGFLASDGEVLREENYLRNATPPKSASYVAISPDGRELRRLGTLPTGFYRGLFVHDALVGSHPGGISAGDGDSFEFRQYDLTGRLRRIIRTVDSTRTISQDEVGRILARRMGNAPANATAREMQRSVDVRTAVPAYLRLQVDPLGRTWIAEPNGPEVGWTTTPDWVDRGRQQWAVFDSTGEMIGLADPLGGAWLPAGRKLVLSWEADAVFIKYTDDDGAVHLAMMRYRIGGPPQTQ